MVWYLKPLLSLENLDVFQKFLTGNFSDFFKRKFPPLWTIRGTIDFVSSDLYLSFQVAFQTCDAINTFAFLNYISILGIIIQSTNIAINSVSHFDWNSSQVSNFLEIVQKSANFEGFLNFYVFTLDSSVKLKIKLRFQNINHNIAAAQCSICSAALKSGWLFWNIIIISAL